MTTTQPPPDLAAAVTAHELHLARLDRQVKVLGLVVWLLIYALAVLAFATLTQVREASAQSTSDRAARYDDSDLPRYPAGPPPVVTEPSDEPSDRAISSPWQLRGWLLVDTRQQNGLYGGLLGFAFAHRYGGVEVQTYTDSWSNGGRMGFFGHAWGSLTAGDNLELSAHVSGYSHTAGAFAGADSGYDLSLRLGAFGEAESAHGGVLVDVAWQGRSDFAVYLLAHIHAWPGWGGFGLDLLLHGGSGGASGAWLDVWVGVQHESGLALRCGVVLPNNGNGGVQPLWWGRGLSVGDSGNETTFYAALEWRG